MVDLYPTKCNICGGRVEYITNDKVYGKQYGSGYCYRCTKCGAYVGTQKPRPKEAMGVLANDRMRKGKMKCHEIFDSIWRGEKEEQLKRGRLYSMLANELGIPKCDCHFGYFDIDMLCKAYKVLLKWQNNIDEIKRELNKG